MCDISVLPAATATASTTSTAVVDVTSLNRPPLSSTTTQRKRSHSLETTISDGDCGGTGVRSITKKSRGRPRLTQSPSRKPRKQKQMKSQSTPEVQSKDAVTQSQCGDTSTACDHLHPAVTKHAHQELPVLNHDVTHSSNPGFLPISSDIKGLQREVGQLTDMVAHLISQVAELTSMLTASRPDLTHVSQPQQFSTSPSHPNPLRHVPVAAPETYSAVAATAPTVAKDNNNIHHQHDEAVAAMYVDQRRKQLRANNIVISGLMQSDNDVITVTELLRSEYEWDFADWPGVTVLNCRRIGHLVDNKVQPLLVTLHSSQQADYYIKNAKFLRGSSNESVKKSVFINPDLTPSEAKAAYELRVERRRRHQDLHGQHPDNSNKISTSLSRTFYRNFNTSASRSVATTRISDTIGPAHVPTNPVTSSKLVWSTQQKPTATISLVIPAPVSDAGATSMSTPAPPYSSPLQPIPAGSTDAIPVSAPVTSNNSSGSCP